MQKANMIMGMVFLSVFTGFIYSGVRMWCCDEVPQFMKKDRKK